MTARTVDSLRWTRREPGKQQKGWTWRAAYGFVNPSWPEQVRSPGALLLYDPRPDHGRARQMRGVGALYLLSRLRRRDTRAPGGASELPARRGHPAMINPRSLAGSAAAVINARRQGWPPPC